MKREEERKREGRGERGEGRERERERERDPKLLDFGINKVEKRAKSPKI